MIVNTHIFRCKSVMQRARFCRQNSGDAKQEARDSLDYDDDFEITDELVPKTAVSMIENDD